MYSICTRVCTEYRVTIIIYTSNYVPNEKGYESSLEGEGMYLSLSVISL